MSKAKTNDKVKVHYTGKLKSGAIFDSSLERDPLEFSIGAGQMIPGFDAAVNGMIVKEKTEVTIPCDEAYGERREDMLQQIPRMQLPEDMKPEVGQTLVASDEGGGEQHVIITDVNEQLITVDANHPLAGEDLIFEIELVSIG